MVVELKSTQTTNNLFSEAHTERRHVVQSMFEIEHEPVLRHIVNVCTQPHQSRIPDMITQKWQWRTVGWGNGARAPT